MLYTVFNNNINLSKLGKMENISNLLVQDTSMGVQLTNKLNYVKPEIVIVNSNTIILGGNIGIHESQDAYLS